MLTRTRRFALVVAALSTALAGSVLGLSSATATPSDGSFLLHFVAVKTSMSTPTKSGAYYEADVEVASGATVGQEVASCVSGKTAITCDGAFVDNNGVIDAHFTVSIKTGVLTGTITGGTGAYGNVSGTVNGTRAYAGKALTIVYTLGPPPPAADCVFR